MTWSLVIFFDKIDWVVLRRHQKIVSQANVPSNSALDDVIVWAFFKRDCFRLVGSCTFASETMDECWIQGETKTSIACSLVSRYFSPNRNSFFH